MKRVILGILLLSPGAFAGDCHYTKITAIQAQTSNVLVRVTNGADSAWKNLGSYSNAHLNAYQAIAQQALATEAPVVLRFPEGHDCKVTDYGTTPVMIRISE